MTLSKWYTSAGFGPIRCLFDRNSKVHLTVLPDKFIVADVMA